MLAIDVTTDDVAMKNQTKYVASKLYGVNATIIIFVFVLQNEDLRKRLVRRRGRGEGWVVRLG